MKNIIPYIAIIALLLFLFNRECTCPGEVTNRADTTVIIHTIPGDSIPYEVVIVKKVPVPVSSVPDTEWIYRDIDTMAILQDYFTINFYHDTLMNDTSAFISLQAHTLENKLFYDELMFQNKRDKKIITTITPPARERMKMFIGGGVNLLPNSPGVSADLLIVTPKAVSLEAGYDFVNKMATVKGFYKISFRKPRDGVKK